MLEVIFARLTSYQQMKLASKSLCLVAASAVLLVGCTKKPVRPNPSETALGPQGNNAGPLVPTEVPLNPDKNTAPWQRDPGIIDDGNSIRGLLQPVYFDFDRDSVKPEERSKLQ